MRARRYEKSDRQRWLSDFCQDLTYSVRTLMRRSPGFTAIALLSIALGVAPLTIVYTAVKAVLINPLPYAHSDELVQFRSEFGNLSKSEQSHTDWIFWNDAQEIIRRNRTLQSAGVYGNS